MFVGRRGGYKGEEAFKTKPGVIAKPKPAEHDKPKRPPRSPPAAHRIWGSYSPGS